MLSFEFWSTGLTGFFLAALMEELIWQVQLRKASPSLTCPESLMCIMSGLFRNVLVQPCQQITRPGLAP